MHYIAGKKLLALLREIKKKNNGDFFCLNCLLLIRTKNKLQAHKGVCENKDFCSVLIAFEDEF